MLLDTAQIAPIIAPLAAGLEVQAVDAVQMRQRKLEREKLLSPFSQAKSTTVKCLSEVKRSKPIQLLLSMGLFPRATPAAGAVAAAAAAAVGMTQRSHPLDTPVGKRQTNHSPYFPMDFSREICRHCNVSRDPFFMASAATASAGSRACN